MVDYRYTLDVLTEDGALLDRRVISPDWKAAGAWAHFEGIRRGCLDPTTGPVAPMVEPVWDPDAGEPVVSAFRVRVRTGEGGEVSRDIPKTYVRSLVEDVSVALVTSGLLVAGQTFRWAVSAFPDPLERADGAVPGDDFGVEDEAQPLPMDHASLGGFLARSAFSSSAKLTFSADTWAAVHAALTLRNRGEMLLGWWHFHPDFCRLRGCPIERRRACDGARPFLSADDVHLHATCFPAGHHVALLVSESSHEEGLARTLFGWWQGMVAARGFHILGGTTNATNAADTANAG
jgi:hypothetical protein